MGENAVDEYSYMSVLAIVNHYTTGEKLKTCLGRRGPADYDMNEKYFLNEFYKQAVTQKARKMLYNEYKKDAKGSYKRISAEQMQKDWQTILDCINYLVSKAKEEIEIANANAVEMTTINEIFSDVANLD